MNSAQYIKYINDGSLDTRLCVLYSSEHLAAQKDRYINAIRKFENLYGIGCEIELFSVSGRSELSGNHTDHNCGCVVAGSIDLDIIAVASKCEGTTIRLTSEGYDEDVVDYASYSSPDTKKYGSSSSIIAGMCAGFSKNGHSVGAFCAYTTSNVLKGSGLSSSAAFEDMVGNIQNHFYNDGRIDNVEIAKIAQWSENVFFGKPCGLMDQVACAVGGAVAIDFKDTKAPIIQKLTFDISKAGYDLCIVNTGGNHADLTDDYASVPQEMKNVASHFGKDVLRGLTTEDIVSNAKLLREKFGDRAVLRALHFLSENERVERQTEALRNGDIEAFFTDVLASGRSSYCYLQNVYTTKNVQEQGLSLALCLCEQFLSDKSGAWRVHGGGFAGTIQAYVPKEYVSEFASMMNSVFGDNACLILSIRPEGAVKL